jgi:hypothetical protein
MTMRQITSPGQFAAPLRILTGFYLLVLVTNATAYAQERIFRPEGVVRFEIEDHLDHPFFFWPRTLLSYPVRFEGDVNDERLSLVRRDTGETVPIQLSEKRMDSGRLTYACVNFFSDLPSGGCRSFELGSKSAGADHKQTAEPLVRQSTDGKTIILDSGAVKVRIPASQAGGDDVPGPIIQMSRGERWLGTSSIVSPRRKVTRIETHQIESGPLFICYQITYSFERGARYTATVKAVSGCDFVQLAEQIEGVEKPEGAYMQLSWSDFHPTHRQAPNHPFQQPGRQSGYGRYDWEKIDEALVRSREKIT